MERQPVCRQFHKPAGEKPVGEKRSHGAHRGRSLLRRFWHDCSGSPALEFAFIFPVFFAFIVAILNIALIYLTQAGLESAAEQASRLLMTGQAQTWGYAPSGTGYSTYNSGNGMTAANFKAAICGQINAASLLSGADPNNTPTYATTMMLPYMDCNKLYIDVQTVNGFANATNLLSVPLNSNGTINSGALNFSTGTQNAVEVVRLIYVWPVTAWFYNASFASAPGGNTRNIVATSVLQTEAYTEPTT